MGSFPEVLIGEDTRLDTIFRVARTIQEVEALTIGDDNIVIEYVGDESLASSLIGWGIVRSIVSSGNQAVLLVRDGTNLKLPGD